MNDLYSITMPGKMWEALREREAMVNNDPADKAARAAFMAAEPHTVGLGRTYVITGEKALVEHILDYLGSLLGLALDGIVPAYEFGCDLKTLRRVIGQQPERAAMTVPQERTEGASTP